MVGVVRGSDHHGYSIDLYCDGVEVDCAGPFDDRVDAEDAAHRIVGDDGRVNLDVRFNPWSLTA